MKSKDLSIKNPYYLPHHRYLELEHFCLQYPDWIEAVNQLSTDLYPRRKLIRYENVTPDPTAMISLRIQSYGKKIDMVKKAAMETDEELFDYILLGVTKGMSYNHLRMVCNIPCCKDVYYNLRRRFFWILNQYRD